MKNVSNNQNKESEEQKGLRAWLIRIAENFRDIFKSTKPTKESTTPKDNNANSAKKIATEVVSNTKPGQSIEASTQTSDKAVNNSDPSKKSSEPKTTKSDTTVNNSDPNKKSSATKTTKSDTAVDNSDTDKKSSATKTTKSDTAVDNSDTDKKSSDQNKDQAEPKTLAAKIKELFRNIGKKIADATCAAKIAFAKIVEKLSFGRIKIAIPTANLDNKDDVKSTGDKNDATIAENIDPLSSSNVNAEKLNSNANAEKPNSNVDVKSTSAKATSDQSKQL